MRDGSIVRIRQRTKTVLGRVDAISGELLVPSELNRIAEVVSARLVLIQKDYLKNHTIGMLTAGQAV